jgi:hypothetical protein
MSRPLRLCTMIAALLLTALLFTQSSHAARAAAARPQTTAPEGILLEAANRDRAAAGLPPLQWDMALAAAARLHAQRMVQSNSLSHQFSGEAPLQQRASQAGARFSTIAENVAEGPTVLGLHTQFMNSAPHRANLLDPELNAVGIALIQSGNLWFVTEDFSAAVPVLNLDAQELQIGALVSNYGLRMVTGTADARKTCDMDRGSYGPRPAAVLRYETNDLQKLPPDIDAKLQSGKFHSAAVGACDAGPDSGFTRFRIAILLFP